MEFSNLAGHFVTVRLLDILPDVHHPIIEEYSSYVLSRKDITLTTFLEAINEPIYVPGKTCIYVRMPHHNKLTLFGELERGEGQRPDWMH